jgi:hypothetical protein
MKERRMENKKRREGKRANTGSGYGTKVKCSMKNHAISLF